MTEVNDKKNKWFNLNASIINKVDGFFDLDKDKEALEEYIDYVNKNRYVDTTYGGGSIGKWVYHYIEKNKTYIKSITFKFSIQDINDIYNDAMSEVLNKPFKFKTFASAYKFYEDYSVKKDGKYFEDFEHRVLITALTFANTKNEAVNFFRIMYTQIYQPATPTFINAGKREGGEHVSCYALEVDDSMSSISYVIGQCLDLSKKGGGVAIELSNLRAKGSAIKKTPNACKGVVPVMKILEDCFSYADQMGQRKGAGAVYLNVFHPDILDFLDTKKINADEKSRIQTLSLGVIIPDIIFKLAKENKTYHTFNPQSIHKFYSNKLKFNDIDFTLEYDKLLSNPKIEKGIEIDARKLLTRIAQTQMESGYPYMVFIDNARKQSPKLTKKTNRIVMSNLCTEIFQTQEPCKMRESIKIGYDKINHDVSCVLGSINISNALDFRNGFELSSCIRIAIRMLNAVCDSYRSTRNYGIAKTMEDYHNIGLGIMNLQGFLAERGIDFQSEEARYIAEMFALIFDYESINASADEVLVKNYGKISYPVSDGSFKNFSESEYYSGEYFTKKIDYIKGLSEKDYKGLEWAEKFIFNDTINEGMYLAEDSWEWLFKHVRDKGMRNAFRLAIAPNQSTAYLHGATPSIMPISAPIETRTYHNATFYYPAPNLNKNTLKYYIEPYYMDNGKTIELVSKMQKHIDQGISTVLYALNTTSTRDLCKFYIQAHRAGLKSLYYTRTKNLSVEECIACQV